MRRSTLLIIVALLVSTVAACGRTDVATRTAPSPTSAAQAAAYPAPLAQNTANRSGVANNDLPVIYPAPVVLPPTDTPIPTPLDGSIDPGGRPRPTFTLPQHTAIAAKEADLQAEENMRATAMARPTLTPNLTPVATYIPAPTIAPHLGLSDESDVCDPGNRVHSYKFAGVSCSSSIQGTTYTSIIAGGATQDDPPTIHWRGAIVVYTSTVNFQNSVYSPIYWTPHDNGTVRITRVAGSQITVQAEDGTIFVFDMTTRTWANVAVPPALSVTGTVASGVLTVTVPTRFQLVFDVAHKWQSKAWYDLASSATTNLARTAGPTLNDRVLQSPLELDYDIVCNSDNATNITMAILEQDTAHSTFRTGWEWHPADGSTFAVTATQTLRATGVWSIDTFLTNKTNARRTVSGLKYALTNLRQDKNWQETLSPSIDRFALGRSDGPMPRPLLVVERSGLRGVFATDGIANRYWSSAPVMLQPQAFWRVSWTNYLWPGQG